MLEKIKNSRMMQVYYYIPLKRHPLLWVFSWTVCVLSIATCVALVEAAFRPITPLDQLEVTRGVLKEIGKRPGRGAYIVVVEELTNEEMTFPSSSGVVPIHGWTLRKLKDEVGKKVELKWSEHWFRPSFKDIWNLRVLENGNVFVSYEKLSKNEINLRDGTQKFIMYLLLAASIVLIYPWLAYRN